MRISREKHWQFLEDELKAETEEFKAKFEAPAKQLLDEKGEMFVALFESFHSNGSMVMKFPNSRALPRKGAHFMCMFLPKELRAHKSWGTKTYKDLYAARFKGTDCVCIYHGKADDDRFSIVGFREVDVEFQKVIENNPGVILVFAPQFPPLDYPANLQKVVKDCTSQSVAEILDAEYKPRAWAPRLIKEDDAARVVLSQMSLTPTTILQGPPGTGKTYLIARVCAELCKAGKSVLVTALTNRALIEVAKKPFLSALIGEGRVSKVNLTVDEAKEVKGLRLVNEITPVSGELTLATFYKSSGCAADTVDDGLFDYVIVDEASQAFTAMFAAASKLGKGRLWVGDINQLAPIVVLNPDRVKDRGYDDLIDGLRFISCNREFPVLQLTKTYRLGERATSFTGMFYGNTLVSGSKARNDLTCLRGIANAEGGPALLLTDMSLGDKAPLSAITQVTSLVKSILAENSRKQVAVLAHRIPTVVAMQRATAREIGNKDGVLVETVAKIQGLTTDITIFVIPNTGYHYGLERRLFNVATSRAREHTIIIVDKSVFEHKEMDQDVLCYLRRLIGEQVGQNASAIEICSDNENDVLEVAIDGAKPLLEKGNNERRTESASDSPTVDITRINKVLDGLQVHLVNWMQPILSKVYPTDFWQKAVMNVLQPDQRDEVMDTGAQSLAELDMAALIAVFLGNFRAIRRETHIAPDVADLAKFVKKIRNIYSHKNAHKIAVPNVEDFTFHMSVVRRFLVALGTDEDNVISHLTLVASLKPQASAKSPTVVKGKGITITVK